MTVYKTLCYFIIYTTKLNLNENIRIVMISLKPCFVVVGFLCLFLMKYYMYIVYMYCSLADVKVIQVVSENYTGEIISNCNVLEDGFIHYQYEIKTLLNQILWNYLFYTSAIRYSALLSY